LDLLKHIGIQHVVVHPVVLRTFLWVIAMVYISSDNE
jgi:hypothetical protein